MPKRKIFIVLPESPLKVRKIPVHHFLIFFKVSRVIKA